MTQPGWRTPFVVLICGMSVLLIAMGVRNTYGLLLNPITVDMGWGREVFSFAMAAQTLIWGLTTPVAGVVADRFGSGRVIAAGGIAYAAGLYMMSVAGSPFEALVGIGFLTGIGMSAGGMSVILSVVARAAPARKRSVYLGIASAGGSSGQFIVVPLGHAAIDGFGWAAALVLLSILIGLTVPLAAALTGSGAVAEDAGPPRQSTMGAVREAGGHSGFLLLTAGYFVCGFQTMFISTHLPAYLDDLGYRAGLAATAIALIGFFNVIGCYLWGAAGDRGGIKYLLSSIYLLRSLVMTGFLLLPVTEHSVYAFSALMGLLWLGTVPLVTGLVVQIFGLRYVATLSGLVFLSHQLGSFLGIWLGGLLYDASGSYDVIWWSGVILGLIAALLHLPIDDRPLARLAAESA